MEFSGACAHRGLVPWLVLLLADFLLAFWIPDTTVEFGIISEDAIEGQDVILRTKNIPPDVIGFMWFRGGDMNYDNFIGSITLNISHYVTGPEYSGREAVNSDGSLLIKKVTPRDQGFYIVTAVLPNSERAVSYGLLLVYPPASVPTLLASNTTVTENEDAVVMTCYTNASNTKWLFNAESLQFGERIKQSEDYKTLTIDPVRREDAGNYQCKVSNPLSSFVSVPVELVVKY